MVACIAKEEDHLSDFNLKNGGKLPPELLESNILAFCGSPRDEVIVGAAVGEDAAVIRWPEGKYLVVSSDPIVGATHLAGKLLVNINLNDIASKGAEPTYFVVTMILPPSLGEEGAKRIMQQIHNECKKYGIAIVGGHTEFNDLYAQPVLVGTMIGVSDRVLSAENIKPGDVILLTHHVGIEGMSILSFDKRNILERYLTLDEIEELERWGGETCILTAAKIAKRKAKFMHDPTEGGFWGALGEISRLVKFGVEVDVKKIPIHPITMKLGEKLKFNPLHLIASGCLIIVVSAEDEEEMLRDFNSAGIPCRRIGKVTSEKGTPIPDTHEELWGLLRL